MGIVLIAMPKSDDALRFKGLIQGYGMMLDTMICSTGSEILRIANDRDFGVVICTKRLRDMERLVGGVVEEKRYRNVFELDRRKLRYTNTYIFTIFYKKYGIDFNISIYL